MSHVARDCSMTVRKKADPEYWTVVLAGRTATDSGWGNLAMHAAVPRGLSRKTSPKWDTYTRIKPKWSYLELAISANLQVIGGRALTSVWINKLRLWNRSLEAASRAGHSWIRYWGNVTVYFQPIRRNFYLPCWGTRCRRLRLSNCNAGYRREAMLPASRCSCSAWEKWRGVPLHQEIKEA